MNSRTASRLLACAALCAASLAAAGADIALRLADRHDLPGYTGDFDHFAYDLKGDRLWLAAEDHGTLDIFNLHTLKMQASLTGIVATPHGILYLPEKDRLVVTDSGGDMLTRVIDAGTNQLTGTIRLAAPGADSMSYDPDRKRLYMVNGGRDAKMKETYISVVDPVTLERHGDLKFDTEKVESMAIEAHGNRMYVTVTGNNTVAVVNKETLAVLATWAIKEAEQSAPLALSESDRRLFVIARKPGTLIILNADTGATVASFKAPERCDQVIWDGPNQRIYALGGEGYIGVFHQIDASHYEELTRISSAPGAKTGLLVPELKSLYVAASPGEATTGAAILRYDVVAAPH